MFCASLYILYFRIRHKQCQELGDICVYIYIQIYIDAYIYTYTHISYQMSVGDRCQLVGWRFGRLICWMVVGMFVGWSVGWAVLWWFGFGVWLILLFAFRDCCFFGGGSSVVSELCSAFLCFFFCFAFWVPSGGVMVCCCWVFWLGRVVF